MMQRLQLQYDKEIAFIEEQQRSVAHRYSPHLPCVALRPRNVPWRKHSTLHCRRALEAQRQELQLALQEDLDAAETRAATAVAQRAELEEKCKKLFSGQMTAQEQTAMAEERAKEERVTLMAKNATRRIKNQGLLKGWTSWHGDWAAAARRRRMLAAAGSRLTKPVVTAAFANWREDWEAVNKTQFIRRGMSRQALERAVEVMQAQLEAAKQHLY